MPIPVDRRTFMNGMAAFSAAGLAAPTIGSGRRQLNVLMIVTDQEQSLASFPRGLIEQLPAHRALLERGTLFENYNVHITPCGPSRSTIFFGRHVQQTGVYLNSDTPPHPVANDAMPTLGTMMQAAGYYTCYKGKWHMSEINGDRNWNQVPREIYPTTQDAMKRFGFDDYGFDGEALGLTWDGYRSDLFVAADTSRNLFDYARGMKTGGKPWFQVVGLINPHDIMFYDATGKQAESRPNPNLLGPLRREPGDPIYEVDHGFVLPESFYKDDLSTKPEAHMAARNRNSQFYGIMELEDEASWRRFINYYYNCIRDVDRRIAQILWALEKSGQRENTIIILTSDHGERAGAHGMRQKSGTMYREEVGVPMIIVHPDIPGGRRTRRLMGPIDIAPTLMALGGLARHDAEERFPGLPGVDVSAVLADPMARTERDMRGHLFNYAAAYNWAPKPSVQGVRPDPVDYAATWDLTKRRLHRGVHDGRWKFARYFAPAHHHTPKNWAKLARLNDLELYDSETDPGEIVNLAHDPSQRANVLRLNAMINALVSREIGKDDGSIYPGPRELYNQPG